MKRLKKEKKRALDCGGCTGVKGGGGGGWKSENKRKKKILDNDLGWNSSPRKGKQ